MFYLLDSMYGQINDNSLRIINLLSKLQIKSKPKIKVYKNSPKQDNCYDCGMFVLCNIEILTKWMEEHTKVNFEELDKVNQKLVSEKRSIIAEIIKQLRVKHK